jgi:hypothetical protein
MNSTCAINSSPAYLGKMNGAVYSPPNWSIFSMASAMRTISSAKRNTH